ncbi:MAG: Histidine kinase [Pedosphaera sp.]|nr:Histidine kinase [Pedosphaera sp.]
MPAPSPNFPDAPVLILAPHGNDARNAAAVLGKVDVRSQICLHMRDLCHRANDRTGAFLVSEEILDTESLSCLLEHLNRQPLWSDIPLVLLTNASEITQKIYNILNFLGARANVTLLEKPLQAITLISVIKAALRSRNHQYEVRNLVESQSLAMEGAQMGSWDTDLRTQTIRRSLRHDQIFGYDALQPEWGMEIFLKHVVEEDRERVRTTYQKAVAEGTLLVECRIYWPDKSVHWIAAQGRVYADENGVPARMAGVVTDITNRKEMEAAARIQRERLDLVLEGTAVGLWYWDIPEARMAWNARCKEHHGLPPDAGVTLATMFEQMLPEDRHSTQRAVALAMEDGRAYDHEYRTVTGRWIRTIGQVFFDHAGNPLRFDGISMDVTRRKQEEATLHLARQQLEQTAEDLERRVKDRTAKLEETVSEMEAFSYSVSHDLRAPLRAMQGYSQALLNDYSEKLEPEGRDFLQRINSAAERLDRLTQDLLTYSRVVRNPVTMTPISLERLVPDVIQQYPNFQPPHAKICIQSPLLDVMGHEASLIQCLSNLIGNAVKFVLPGVKPRITIWTEPVPAARAVRIWVEDNGIGIETDQSSRVFGIFERVSKKYEGTGIGLAIVRKAAERMGGAVGVESTLGRGSRFWLQLPANKS